MPKHCQCFEAYLDGKPVAFRAVLHQPNKIVNLKRGSRIVVLPDYQGIGIGYALQTYIAKYYSARGYTFHTVTSAKNFICKLNKSKDWKLLRWGTQTRDPLNPRIVKDRKTATFMYVGEGYVEPYIPSEVKMRKSIPRRSKRK